MDEKDKIIADQDKEIRKELKKLRKMVAGFRDKNIRLEYIQRNQSLLKHLLKQNKVIEIEISGRENRCCYREDPKQRVWRSCGHVPSEPHESWLYAQDGGKLFAALQETKGGNAITIVRQGRQANHNINIRLRDLIKREVREQKAYIDDRASFIQKQCKP